MIKWDMAETSRGGPFKELLLDTDVLINCIYLDPKAPKSQPFISTQLLDQHKANRRLSVIADVSCDTTNPNSPLPIYRTLTTFEQPTLVLGGGGGGGSPSTTPLEIIAIDHLPSMVPRESTKEFTDHLIGHMVEFDHDPVWQRALALFNQKIASIRA